MYMPWSISTSCGFVVPGMVRTRRLPACGSMCSFLKLKIISLKAWMQSCPISFLSRPIFAMPSRSLAFTPSMYSITTIRLEHNDVYGFGT